ncbi:hypothetical protein VM1G_02416 [Cytospora mali]|uniref:Uncharacterized protein n=1 Tax=Cytospora mali TaxID=578113 RepID=A0A194VSQ2_CYTMA|nr:hypothetical protein VM1G_02416 [Valsa mali]
MSGITKEQRIQSWNVQILVGRKRIAGVYQRDNLLSVADIAQELELCLIFDKPGAPWQPALLDDESKHLIILDHQNNLPFPTPDGLRDYTYVFHSPQCSRDLHSLADPCIRCATLPNRRADPRYQEIGKQSQDDRLSMVPLRKVATLKRRSTSASPVSQSPSPTKMSCLDEPIPRVVISPDEARPFINDFRANVLANWCTCVISGKGESWFRSGIVGPA